MGGKIGSTGCWIWGESKHRWALMLGWGVDRGLGVELIGTGVVDTGYTSRDDEN